MSSFFRSNNNDLYTIYKTVNPIPIPLNHYLINTSQQLDNNFSLYKYGTRKKSYFRENGVDIGSLFQVDAETFVNILGGSYNIYPWGINSTLFQNANWIWATANANISSPGSDAGIFYWFYYSFYYSGEPNTGKIHGICDNIALIFFNNSTSIEISGGWNQGASGTTTNANISIVKGLNYIRVAAYNIGSGTTNVSGLNVTIYSGYYADDISFFNTAISTYNGTGITDFTSINTATNGNKIINEQDLYSVMWYGIFYSDYTGTWTFSITSDDASYMWIGDIAISGYTTTNATLNNGLVHGFVTVTGSVNLTAGQFYPIRIVFGENYGSDNCVFTYSRNGSASSSDFTGKFLTPPYNPAGLMISVYDSGGTNIANTNSKWTFSTTSSPYNTTTNYSNPAGALIYNQNAI